MKDILKLIALVAVILAAFLVGHFAGQMEHKQEARGRRPEVKAAPEFARGFQAGVCYGSIALSQELTLELIEYGHLDPSRAPDLDTLTLRAQSLYYQEKVNQEKVRR